MSHRQGRSVTSGSRAAIALGALFTGTLVMGCAEMLVMGMLDLMAEDLAVPVPAVGVLVSANALGIAVGGPLLAFLTARLDGRTVLLAAITTFTALNLLPALGAGLEAFIAARVVIGAVEGLFIAAAITTATSIVPPERAGRAMAVVISGFAVSGAVGMPLGRLLGEAVGWRASFLGGVAEVSGPWIGACLMGYGIAVAAAIASRSLRPASSTSTEPDRTPEPEPVAIS